MSFALPYAIWLMATYFQTVPVELEDAARLDGCSRLGILFRVLMPIFVPGLVSTAMFVFLLAGDEFFFALIFTSTLAPKTVPVAIAEFIGLYLVNVNGMMAGGIQAAVPGVQVALIFQRYIVSGMTAGAVKGWDFPPSANSSASSRRGRRSFRSKITLGAYDMIAPKTSCKAEPKRTEIWFSIFWPERFPY